MPTKKTRNTYAINRVGIKSALFASGGTWSLVEYAYLPDTDLKDHADTKGIPPARRRKNVS